MRSKFFFGWLTVIFLGSTVAAAQDVYTGETCKERSGFEYGGIAGFYFPSNKTADFYSGKPGSENDVDYVFSNHYWYEELRKLLDFNDTIFVREYPGKMSYSPAFSFGLFASYNFNCRTAIYAQFYFVKLRANDVVTIEVDPPQDYLDEPDIRLCPIKGIEERNLLDIGVMHSIGMNKTARLILGGGLSMNNVLVKESAIYIAEKKYNLVNIYGNRPYVPGSNQQAYEIRQGGIGFGIFGSVGTRLEFSPAIAIEPGVSVHLMKVALEENAGFTPHFNLYVRLHFRDIIEL